MLTITRIIITFTTLRPHLRLISSLPITDKRGSEEPFFLHHLLLRIKNKKLALAAPRP
jgi:hypothetical protein